MIIYKADSCFKNLFFRYYYNNDLSLILLEKYSCISNTKKNKNIVRKTTKK